MVLGKVRRLITIKEEGILLIKKEQEVDISLQVVQKVLVNLMKKMNINKELLSLIENSNIKKASKGQVVKNEVLILDIKNQTTNKK